jgi:hypothetical protein
MCSRAVAAAYRHWPALYSDRKTVERLLRYLADIFRAVAVGSDNVRAPNGPAGTATRHDAKAGNQINVGFIRHVGTMGLWE